MKTTSNFFLWASGADSTLLEQCPSEKSKYAAIGATIFFTGLLAAIAAAYALFTVFDSYWISISFGIVWGAMIYNLDRYIVASMRKEGSLLLQFFTAMPRIVLATIISLVISKPLELKIFGKEIEPKLVVMERQVYASQEAETRLRFEPILSELRTNIQQLKHEIIDKAVHRDALALAAQQEADGTGGSRIKNLGSIYKVKKADADRAEVELKTLSETNRAFIVLLEEQLRQAEADMKLALDDLVQPKLNGFAARLEALNRLTDESDTMWWAHVFILFLFIILELSPIMVKLISKNGPYDALLHMAEHEYRCKEVEFIAMANAETKKRTAHLGQTEANYAIRKLDAELL